MARTLSDWISYYLEYTDDTEPPESYHVWTAVSVIAGTVQRKICMPWGHSKIYPNLYVVLVGPSGRTRKGIAMDIGMTVFQDAQGKTTAEALSKEKLIREFANSILSFDNPDTNTIEYHSSMMTFSKELSVFLGQRDIGFIADLTDWYDSHDTWRYQTKTSGSDHIRGLCFNLLAGTAPDWFQSMLPLEAIGGGFTSRIIFVAERNKRKVVAEPKETNPKLRKLLVADLEKIALLAGYYKFSEPAKEAYVLWYQTEEEKMASGEYAIQDIRFNGYCERRATHIKKIAMLMTVSRSDDKVVELKDFNRARELMIKTEKKMSRVFGGLGASLTGNMLEKILVLLMDRKMIKRSEVLKQFRYDITMPQLEEIENALVSMKYITRDLVDGNSDRLYTYIGKTLDSEEGE